MSEKIVISVTVAKEYPMHSCWQFTAFESQSRPLTSSLSKTGAKKFT